MSIDTTNIPNTSLSGGIVGAYVPLGTFEYTGTLGSGHKIVANGAGSGADAVSSISLIVEPIPATLADQYGYDSGDTAAIAYLQTTGSFHAEHGDDFNMDFYVDLGTLVLLTAADFTLGSDLTMSAATDFHGASSGQALTVATSAHRHFTLYPDSTDGNGDASISSGAGDYYPIGVIRTTGKEGNLTAFVADTGSNIPDMCFPIVGTITTLTDATTFSAAVGGNDILICADKALADAHHDDTVAAAVDTARENLTDSLTVSVLDTTAGVTMSQTFDFSVIPNPNLQVTFETPDGYDTNEVPGWLSTDATPTIATVTVQNGALESDAEGGAHTAPTFSLTADNNFAAASASKSSLVVELDTAADSEAFYTLAATKMVYTENGRSFNVDTDAGDSTGANATAWASGADLDAYYFNPLVINSVTISAVKDEYIVTGEDIESSSSANDMLCWQDQAVLAGSQITLNYQYGLGAGTFVVSALTAQSNSDSGANLTVNDNAYLDNTNLAISSQTAVAMSNSAGLNNVGVGDNTANTDNISADMIDITTAPVASAGATSYMQFKVEVSVTDSTGTAVTADCTGNDADQIVRVYANLETVAPFDGNFNLYIDDANISTGTVFGPVNYMKGGVIRSLDTDTGGPTYAEVDAFTYLNFHGDNDGDVVKTGTPVYNATDAGTFSVTDLTQADSGYEVITSGTVTCYWYQTATLTSASSSLLLINQEATETAGTESAGVLFDGSNNTGNGEAVADGIFWLGSGDNELTRVGGSADWDGTTGGGEITDGGELSAYVYNEANDTEDVAKTAQLTLGFVAQTNTDTTLTLKIDTTTGSWETGDRYNIRLVTDAGPTLSGDYLTTTGGSFAVSSAQLWSAQTDTIAILFTEMQLTITSDAGNYVAWTTDVTGGPLVNIAPDVGEAQNLGTAAESGRRVNDMVLYASAGSAITVTGAADDSQYKLVLVDRVADDGYDGTYASPNTASSIFQFIKTDGTLLGNTITVDTTDGSVSYTPASGTLADFTELSGIVALSADDATLTGVTTGDIKSGALVLYSSNAATAPGGSGNDISNVFIVPMVAFPTWTLDDVTLTPTSSASTWPDRSLFTWSATGSNSETDGFFDGTIFTYSQTGGGNLTDLSLTKTLQWVLSNDAEGDTAIPGSFSGSTATETNINEALDGTTDSRGLPERAIGSLFELANDPVFAGGNSQLITYRLSVQSTHTMDGTGVLVTDTSSSLRTDSSAAEQFRDWGYAPSDVMSRMVRQFVADDGTTFHSMGYAKALANFPTSGGTATYYSIELDGDNDPNTIDPPVDD